MVSPIKNHTFLSLGSVAVPPSVTVDRPFLELAELEDICSDLR